MINNKYQLAFLDQIDRTRKFLSVTQKELESQGFTVTNIFDVPNLDETGNALCEVDDTLTGFEVTRIEDVDGRDEYVFYNHFYGSMTHLFWDERGLLDLDATDEEVKATHPLTTVSGEVEGKWVFIDGSKSAQHYKAILDAAKGLKLQGMIDYGRLKDAARRYILSAHHNCKAKGLRPPRMSTASLMR